MTIGERLRSIRVNRKMTQEELASLLGVSYQVISQYERDLRNPKYETAIKLADALSVSPRYLFTGTMAQDGIDDDDRFTRAFETLDMAGFTVEQDEHDAAHAEWRLTENEHGIAAVETEARLVNIVEQILDEAEARKQQYIKSRLIAEFKYGAGGANHENE